MTRITGLPVSPGLAWGPAALMLQRHPALRYSIAPSNVDREVRRLDEARGLTASQLQAIRARVSQRAGADVASLFEAQRLMIDDDRLVPRARRIVSSVSSIVSALTAIIRATGRPFAVSIASPASSRVTRACRGRVRRSRIVSVFTPSR